MTRQYKTIFIEDDGNQPQLLINELKSRGYNVLEGPSDIDIEKNALVSLKRYKDLADNLSDMILIVGISGEILEANEAAVKTYGYSYEELLVRSIFDLRKDNTLTENQLSKAQLEGIIFETIHLKKDGSPFPVEVCSRCTIINGMDVLMSIIRDISDRKNSEQALRESEEKYRLLFNNSTDAIFVQEIPQDGIGGKLIEVNDTACRLFGYTKEKLYTMRPSDFTIGGNIINIQNIIKNFEVGNQASFDMKGITSDKRQIDIEIRLHKIKLKDKYLLLEIVRDITERNKIINELKASTIKYEYLLMNMNNAFGYFKVITDNEDNPCDCIHVEVNNVFSEMVGQNREDIIGKSILSTFSVNVMKDFLGSLIRVSFTGENFKVDDLYLKNTDKWCSVYAFSPEKGYFALLLNDITDQKKAAEAMKKGMEAAKAANKSKSEFLANMSHEIRTPLNGIIGMTNLTLMTELSNQQKENLMIVKNSADSLLNVINDILDLSKMEAGKLVIEKITFDLKNLFEKIIKTHSVKANEKGLDFNCMIDHKIPKFLKGDPYRLQQILNNLAGNAVKFTESGSIKVIVNLEERVKNTYSIRFSVIDTGIGIAQNDLPKLFQNFSQIDGSYTKRFGGTGLGLAITKQLVEMMGGSIGVKSEEGKGSLFECVLDFEDGEVKYSIIGKENDIQFKKTLSSLSILVVEDDKVNQTITSLMLNSMGHRTSVAENGKEALELYETGNFDIILMDIQLPEMDGIQATKIIRKKEAGTNKHTPIIALTAFVLKGDKEHFLSEGMDEYIGKPFKIEELYTIIEGISSKIKRNIGYEEMLYVPNASIENGKLIFSEIVSHYQRLKNSVTESIDMDHIEKEAHEIKKAASFQKFSEIRVTAFRIELAARRGDLKETEILIRDMGMMIKNMENQINKI